MFVVVIYRGTHYQTTHPFRLCFLQLLLDKYEINGGTGAVYIFLTTPMLVVGSMCLLLVTDVALPLTRTSWFTKPIQSIRAIGGSKLNQFGLGDHKFVAFFCFFVVFPILAYLIENIERRIIRPQEEPPTAEDNLHRMADYFGIVGSLALSFVLIPVARHNILLTAVGWSPALALRLHILSGYFSFIFIMLHGLLYVVDMFVYGKGSIIDQAIPDAHCWKWRPMEDMSEEMADKCELEWWFFTGFISAFFFIALAASLLHLSRDFWAINACYGNHALESIGLLYSAQLDILCGFDDAGAGPISCQPLSGRCQNR